MRRRGTPGLAEDERQPVRGDSRVLDLMHRSGRARAQYHELVVATGSVPAIPPLEGLSDVHCWTKSRGDLAQQYPGQLIVSRWRVDVARATSSADGRRRHARRGGTTISSLASMRRRSLLSAVRAEREPGLVQTGADSVEAVVDGARLHLSSGEAIDAARLLRNRTQTDCRRARARVARRRDHAARRDVDDCLSAGDGDLGDRDTAASVSSRISANTRRGRRGQHRGGSARATIDDPAAV